MGLRLRECCRQSKAEVVSNSRNKFHQTWGLPSSRALSVGSETAGSEGGPPILTNKEVKWDGGILPLPFSVWHPSISEVRLAWEEEGDLGYEIELLS